MHRAKKPLLLNLNEHLVCNLCKGYFIDATTIIECLHTFCRSCIVRYLETTKYCPVCDVQVHKSKPLLSLRPDKVIQDIVYKLVPRLFNNELQRRKEFYRKNPEAKPSVNEDNIEATYCSILMPEEELCLTLNYHGSSAKPRYLRCPSAVSIMHLQKLIRAKFDLSETHHVDILHNQDCLNPCCTLMDIVYIYKLSKMEPLDLTYRIYEYMAKKMKLENREIKSVDQTEVRVQPIHSNNNNWKEVQLRISENGEMSITGIQDTIPSQNFTPEMIEVLDTKPKSPNTNFNLNPVKKKDLSDVKFIPKTSSSQINIISNEKVVVPYPMNRLNEATIFSVVNKDVCNMVSAVTVPCINAATTTVFSTINSMKCSVRSRENETKTGSNMDVDSVKTQEVLTESPRTGKEEIQLTNDRLSVKRKSDYLNNESLKKHNPVLKKYDVKTPITSSTEAKMTPVRTLDTKLSNPKTNHVKNDEKCENHTGIKRKLENETIERRHESVNQRTGTGTPPVRLTEDKLVNHVKTDVKQENQPGSKRKPESETNESHVELKPVESISNENSNLKTKISVDGKNTPKNEVVKTHLISKETTHNDGVDPKLNYANKNLNNSTPNRPGTPKPSTKYQGPSQPCYMPKTAYSPVINVPKPLQSSSSSKSDGKMSKSVINAKNDVRMNCAPNLSTAATTSSNAPVTNSKVNVSPKPKQNSPMGYKTLRDPPKSWNSQISKANLTKPQPDPKYSDLKNVRPAKFFKMRNNMLRFLGNPASGVKPMYSVHVSPEKEKPQEKIVENREIKKHSIVKIDPKTLKPISEKAPETSSLSSQVSTTTDLKINTSSVSIFNPLKLQSNSPKSDRKSPKSPQSPKTKTAPSPPVLKRDKPNLNFTPPNPFIPNLSSQTINPNQFLCNSGPPGFPSYDPRVMVAAYHNLLYGPGMGFPHSPLPYHLGGMDINQRGKGFDISKIVGMQQQPPSTNKSPISPQSSPKLETPIVPPQVPYQPRPSPMSLKPPNAKRLHKDPSKNEKSLQNTVEKLTLSRAKEIHKAAEILNKSQSTLEEKKGTGDQSRTEKSKDKEGTRIPSVVDNKSVEIPNNNPSSQTRTKPESEDVKAKTTSLAFSNEEKETKNVIKNETRNELKEPQADPSGNKTENKEGKTVSKTVPVSDNAKKDDSKTKQEESSCQKRTLNQKPSVDSADNMWGSSDNSKKNNDNNNEAGSEKLERVTGDI